MNKNQLSSPIAEEQHPVDGVNPREDEGDFLLAPPLTPQEVQEQARRRSLGVRSVGRAVVGFVSRKPRTTEPARNPYFNEEGMQYPERPMKTTRYGFKMREKSTVHEPGGTIDDRGYVPHYTRPTAKKQEVAPSFSAFGKTGMERHEYKKSEQPTVALGSSVFGKEGMQPLAKTNVPKRHTENDHRAFL